jgi:predicted peptidase
MRKTLARLAAAALLAVPACTTTNTTPPAVSSTPSTQMAKHFKLTREQTLETDYLLFLPKGFDAQSTKRWPLILFLHGAGERGTDIWKVAKHGPPREVTEHPDFPFIVVSPQCPDGRIWSDDVVMALLDETAREYPVDTKRVYLTGLSMGGYGAWSLAVNYPERFAAVVPICGGGNMISILLADGEKGAALKTLGIWAFHGAKDPTVPLEESERMIYLMQHLGAKDVKLTVYPEAKHDAWTETYKNPELYKWLLMHHR